MPCCILALLALLGPRVLLVLIWIFNNDYLSRVYSNLVIPLLGFILLPWTTLAYAFAANTFRGNVFAGVDIIGLIIVLIGLILDLSSYGGGGYGNRSRIRGYYRSA